jgi:hypothetical protein
VKTKTLYRPVGEKEMILIIESEYKQFPARLEWQPIFCPVLNELYAVDIASQWNINDPFGNYLGFVTKFEIWEESFSKYEIQNVGAEHHNELWVPAQELALVNGSIVGDIEVAKVYVGEKFMNSENEAINELIKKIR